MILSVNWLKQFTQIDASIDELATVIGARLVEIEGVESLGGKYKDVIIARIVECAPVEDSDHLNVTKIDDGGSAADAQRDENGYVQVVCGAPNVRVGLLVAWLPPGSTVPDTYGEAEPFVLGARKLRGFMSNGMLASARELDLFDDHDGIVEVDKDVAPGTPFMEAYALDDYLLDIENKSLTHRPDTFGVIGFAREVAAIAGQGFQAPEWYEELLPRYASPADGEAVELSAAIDDAALSSRYQAIALGSVTQSARTPLEIQTYLSRSGVRPISPIVDVTNYLMLLTGQPLHAFDYDKVVALSRSPHLHVRGGYDGETLHLLDGRTIALAADDIVIAAGDHAVALAGAMGGAETEIDASTKRIIIESATFNLYNLRRTQMRHGIFSEAITRFTKGQPAALTAPVLARAVAMLGELCGAQVISDVADDYPHPIVQPTLSLRIDTVNGVLGTHFNATDAAELLLNVQCTVSVTIDDDGEVLAVTPPYWRTDIHIAEDVIEEIGRLNGFDLIEQTLPTRDSIATMPDTTGLLRQTLRERLASAGANEVVTYSFVHGNLLSRAGQSSEQAYALSNAISPDLQFYRLSLTPSLLDKVATNIRTYDEFGLFEFGKTHVKDVFDEREPELPAEFGRIGFTYTASDKQSADRGAAYYTARRYLDDVFNALHISHVTLKPLAEESSIDVASALFEPKRSAAVYAGDTYIGIIGEYKRTVMNAFKLPNFSAGFELLLDPLQMQAKAIGVYVPLSRYPSSDSDATFTVPEAMPFHDLDAAIAAAITSEELTITYVTHDIYAPENSDSKNITVRFTFVSYDKTLTRELVNDDMKRIIGRVLDELTSVHVV